MKEQVEELLNELAFLTMDWNNLGWDTDGCPDGDECEDFSDKLARIEDLAKKVEAKLNEK